ncbi:ADP-ribosylglycohydrolase family protein [candidate division KSB1 bacterium]|nr:ADP-ribosylglycohydrolase family protein [candidate division KSB1 bacterium]
MKYNFLLFIAVLFSLTMRGYSQSRIIEREDYADQLHGMWLGECIANWTGLVTEGKKTSPPFYTDEDWSAFNYALTNDPWEADDDTDIEYVYLYLLDQYRVTTLTPEMIRDGWMKHINNWIWVSNAKARRLFDFGVLPPSTGLLAANDLALRIDAQLTTEFFGALAPGIPQKALAIANMPILTTSTGYASHAAQFHVILYSLVSLIDRRMPKRNQALWLVTEARKFIPESSKAADVIDFVMKDYLANPDADDWESTRDKMYIRYQGNDSDYGFRYQGWTESGLNLGVSVLSLLYGEMDYKKTVRIGTLAGWDSDNPTASMGGLLGLYYGYNSLCTDIFPGQGEFSDRYHFAHKRDALPDYLPDDSEAEDTFFNMARRMLPVIDLIVQEGGGSMGDESWIIPPYKESGLVYNPLYELTQRSVNNQILYKNGIIKVKCTTKGDHLDAVVDGFELDFSGVEWFGQVRDFVSRADDYITLTVEYDRSVSIHTIRFIEASGVGGYKNASVQLRTDGEWMVPIQGVYQQRDFDPDVGLQIIDFVLHEPLSASGIRISGEVTKQLRVLEFDALTEPWAGVENLLPNVAIIKPELGQTFTAPAEILIQANAQDSDGTIQYVEFYSEHEKLGRVDNEPYIFKWKNVKEGVYTLTARAVDDRNAVVTSRPVWITVSMPKEDKEFVWHSYNVETTAGFPQATVADDNSGLVAGIEFYESLSGNSIVGDALFQNFKAGPHPERFNSVQDFWTNNKGNIPYPYAGKNSIKRGDDPTEHSVPEPLGVYDLQLHPPNSNNKTVCSFIVVRKGSYFLSNLGARRISSEGNSVTFYVFNHMQELITQFPVYNDQNWVMSPEIYEIGGLDENDRIYFSVDKGYDGQFGWDATEICWTVTKKKDISADTVGKKDKGLPIDFELLRNFPNPFNQCTFIQVRIFKESDVDIAVFDIIGRRVKTLKKGRLFGSHRLFWDSCDENGISVSSGVYFVQLRTPERMFSKKIILIR